MNPHLKKIISTILLLFTIVLQSQNSQFTAFTLNDGLPQSNVQDIVQDANGYLWIATDGGGIARFDGSEFKVLTEKDGLISKVCFQGSGCAISTASASLMTDIMKNKTVSEALELINEFQEFITIGKTDNLEKLGKLSVLAGVSEFPMRVKCATLPWHTLKAALINDQKQISTE